MLHPLRSSLVFQSLFSLSQRDPEDAVLLHHLLSFAQSPSNPQAGSSEVACLSIALRQSQCVATAVAQRPQHYDFDLDRSEGERTTEGVPATASEYHHVDPGQFHSTHQYFHQDAGQQQEYFSHGMSTVLPPQASAPESMYAVQQAQLLAPHLLQSSPASQFGSPYHTPRFLSYQQQGGRSSRKRHREEDVVFDFDGLQQLQGSADSGTTPLDVELTPHGHHAQLQQSAVSYQYLSPQPRSNSVPLATLLPTQHHHHRLPNQPPPNKIPRTDNDSAATATPEPEPSTMVGKPGMPAPAPRPKGPKLKFTRDDDALLVQLKETKNLTWKQIADFFPGRSSATLQVRYCTKLKAKTILWTDDMTQRLRNAMREYESDRWRVIAGKVGHGFSAAACRDKAATLHVDERETSVAATTTPERAESS